MLLKTFWDDNISTWKIGASAQLLLIVPMLWPRTIVPCALLTLLVWTARPALVALVLWANQTEKDISVPQEEEI